jgi:hypothetical protein
MNEQVKEVINEIAAQLGVASQYVVTEMAKYKIASNVVPLLVGIFAVLACRFIYNKANKFLAEVNEKEIEYAKKNDRTPDTYGWFKFDEYSGIAVPMVTAWITIGVFALIAIVFLSCSLSEIITWLVAPTGSMINYVLIALK